VSRGGAGKKRKLRAGEERKKPPNMIKFILHLRKKAKMTKNTAGPKGMKRMARRHGGSSPSTKA